MTEPTTAADPRRVIGNCAYCGRKVSLPPGALALKTEDDLDLSCAENPNGSAGGHSMWVGVTYATGR